MRDRPAKLGRRAFLSVMRYGKPHVYRRSGMWWIYNPPIGFSASPDPGPVALMGNSISDHRRAAGFMS